MHKSDYDAFVKELAEVARESDQMVIVVVSCGRENGIQTLAKTYGNPSPYSTLIAFDVCADLRTTILNSRKKDILQ